MECYDELEKREFTRHFMDPEVDNMIALPSEDMEAIVTYCKLKEEDRAQVEDVLGRLLASP